MTYYDILDLPVTAGLDEIKKAYYQLARIYHPDKLHTSDLVSEEKFKMIQAAYETLSSPEKRACYDAEISRKITFCPDISFGFTFFVSILSLFKTCVREDEYGRGQRPSKTP